VWFPFYFQQIATCLGVFALTAGAAIAWYRSREISRAVQLLGGLLLVAVLVITLAVRFNIDANGRMAHVHWWRAQEVLSGAGLILFGMGYFWERITRKP
jgi:hypothetical protein